MAEVLPDAPWVSDGADNPFAQFVPKAKPISGGGWDVVSEAPAAGSISGDNPFARFTPNKLPPGYVIEPRKGPPPGYVIEPSPAGRLLSDEEVGLPPAGPRSWGETPVDAPPFDPSKPWTVVSEAPAPASASSGIFSKVGPVRFAADAASGLDPIAQTMKNIPSSAAHFASDFAYPFMNPIEAANAIKNIGQGALEKVGIMSGTEHVKYADALGKFLVDRYGSIENATHTLVHDPVGVAADASMFLTGGGTLAARVPGVIGKVGEVASIAGRTIDPISAAVAASKLTGKAASEVIGGLGTHTGGESLRIAARAGYEGGEAAKAFRENLRGATPMEDVVADARGAVQQLRQQRGQAYRDSMAGIGADTTVLDFRTIDQAVANANAVKTFKGQSLSPSTEAIRDKLNQAIADWKGLSPTDFHTAEGLDALKQKIGDIRDATQYATPERVAADRVYNAVKATIVNQAPEYAKAMKGYEQASTQIREIEHALSLNPNASVDTALRKLQSVLRNNVNANYGQRAQLADFLVNAGAPHLMEKLAGQALNPWMARGLGKLGMQLATEIGLVGGTLAHGAGAAAALPVAATLPFMSPRLMGEAAYFAGRAAAPMKYVPARPIARGTFQTSRESQQPQSAGGRVDYEQQKARNREMLARRKVEWLARRRGGRINRDSGGGVMGSDARYQADFTGFSTPAPNPAHFSEWGASSQPQSPPAGNITLGGYPQMQPSPQIQSSAVNPQVPADLINPNRPPPQAQVPGGAPIHPAGIPPGVPTDAATGAPSTVPVGQNAGKQPVMVPGGAPIQPTLPPTGTFTSQPMPLAAPQIAQAPPPQSALLQPESEDVRQFGTHRRRGGRVDPANIDPHPTEGQRRAGNFAKDHVRVHGLDISIENAKGSMRTGTGKDGKPWSVKMPANAHYGYIKGTVGKDKDHVDCYLGPHPKIDKAFVIDQIDADSGKFDEHKCLLGFATAIQAIDTYLKAFSDARGGERLGHITAMPVDQFKRWLEHGDTTRPMRLVGTAATKPGKNPRIDLSKAELARDGHRYLPDPYRPGNLQVVT